MSKSKKARKPQIDPRVLTRPRLDALFASHERAELDDDGLYTGVQSLMAELGEQHVLDALVKRMEGTPENERGVLMTIVERLKSSSVIAYLWRQVKKPRAMSLDAKLTALTVLKVMGEEVDVDDPTRYFSPRELKTGDIQSVEKLLNIGWRAIARSLRTARDSSEVEAMMSEINRVSLGTEGDADTFMSLLLDAEKSAGDLEADFLLALAYTTHSPKVHHTAEQVLARLAQRNVAPVTPAILDLKQERFHAAYTTGPENPFQRSVIVAWERAGGVIQAFVFLLDFGLPWGGAIKDVFLSKGMTAAEFQRIMVDPMRNQFSVEGLGVYRIRLATAQEMIAAAVESNHNHHIELSADFNTYRHLMDRWVLDPSASSIEADTTEDELDEIGM